MSDVVDENSNPHLIRAQKIKKHGKFDPSQLKTTAEWENHQIVLYMSLY